MKIILVLLLPLFVLVGCGSKPSDSTTKDLAMGYFGNEPGVTKDTIKVLKSFEREGAPVMTFQIGGMICDMPVLKTDSGWIARGYSCNGSIGQIAAKPESGSKEFYLQALRAEQSKVEANPPAEEDGVRFSSMNVMGDSVIYGYTLTPDAAARLKGNADFEKNMKASICTNVNLVKTLQVGVVHIFNYYSPDKTVVAVVVDKNTCN